MHATIIGKEGGMGQWMTKHLKSLGYTVTGFDKRRGDTPSILGKADLVVVSVPIQVTAETIKHAVRHMKPAACLMEIASLKSGIHDVMGEAAEQGLKVLCVHPMFGPSVEGLEGKIVAVVPVIDAEYEKEMTVGLFPGSSIEVVEACEHDRLMSVILSLPYLINLAIAVTIKNEDLERLRRLSGTTFMLQYILAQSVTLENPNLIEALISQNQYLAETAERFIENTQRIARSIENTGFSGYHRGIFEAMRSDPLFVEAHKLRQTAFNAVTMKQNPR